MDLDELAAEWAALVELLEQRAAAHRAAQTRKR